MQRRYRTKKYYCGEYLEVAIYPVYIYPKKRGKRSKPTTEIQQRLNQRHTEGRLRRLLHTNFTPSDLFATLTFDEVNLPASVEDAQRLLQNFLRRLKRKYARLGLDAKYIYVLEYGQEHNRLHIHLVLTGGITRAELAKLWGLGEVNADALHFEKDGLATLAKYLTKGGESDERPTWKRWSGSRNLEQPTVTQRDGQLSHRKMASLCQDGGDENYLETLVDGYEMADFSLDITPEFGGMEAFQKVLEGVHQRGMKLIMDLVVNHTSDEHEWFQKSRQRIEPYTDYYIWRPGPGNGKLPNNWDSNFEGKAWTWDEVRKEYYLHLFSIKQPDLNMDNPLVREEVKKILRFWLDMGVDGFREDVITYISKKEGLPNDRLFPIYKGMRHYNHGPHIHEYLEEFKQDVFSKYDCFTLAEAPLVWPKQALKYIDEEKGQIDMMIQFQCQCAACLFTDYMPLPFSLRRMKKAFSNWQEKLSGRAWNMLYLENHDHPRILPRYGSEEFWKESGKALAVSYLFQQGTPFLYQGQEIGMLNWKPEDPEMYEDVQTRYTYAHSNLKKSPEVRLQKMWRSSRDSARTPVQWDDTENAGFTTGKPWFYVNQNYTKINVAQQETDPDSILQFYRKAIALRKELPVVRHGSYKCHFKHSSKLYVYSRETEKQTLLVVCSFSKKATKLKLPKGYSLENGKLLLSNYQNETNLLKPYECRVYLLEN